MVKFTNINNIPISKKNRPARKEKWYIFKTEYLLAAAFFKSAGGVGRIILDYILWKRSMNGNEWITLPNTHFKVHFQIDRQRKSEALFRLERDQLIDVERRIGKPTLVKLTVRN
mgnify:CR=1|jgi:hypothetical protein|tara:strand:+ start:100 stop:441 length:342 start_codon:yes stop_codon:yes gene_type:complete